MTTDKRSPVNAINELATKLGVVVTNTPSLSFGLNNKIVCTSIVSETLKTTFTGRHYVNMLGKEGNFEGANLSFWGVRGNHSTSVQTSADKYYGTKSLNLISLLHITSGFGVLPTWYSLKKYSITFFEYCFSKSKVCKRIPK